MRDNTNILLKEMESTTWSQKIGFYRNVVAALHLNSVKSRAFRLFAEVVVPVDTGESRKDVFCWRRQVLSARCPDNVCFYRTKCLSYPRVPREQCITAYSHT